MWLNRFIAIIFDLCVVLMMLKILSVMFPLFSVVFFWCWYVNIVDHISIIYRSYFESLWLGWYFVLYVLMLCLFFLSYIIFFITFFTSNRIQGHIGCKIIKSGCIWSLIGCQFSWWNECRYCLFWLFFFIFCVYNVY